MKLTKLPFLLSLAIFFGFTSGFSANPVYVPISGFELPAEYPEAALVSDGAGNFWGTTQYGGAYNAGTIFKVDGSTGAITTVAQFGGSLNTSNNLRGGAPVAELVSDGVGYLWGTTLGGGPHAAGTIFKVNISTGVVTTVVDFDGSSTLTDNERSSDPEAALVSDGLGNLWGTTVGSPGLASKYGTVFKVNISTGAITTVVDFDGSTTAGDNTQGGFPHAALVSDGAGNLWGTTAGFSSLPSGVGTVFKINVNTGAITTVAVFDNSNKAADNTRGSYPQAAMVSDGAGNLWGTTSGGGKSFNGTVYKVNVDTGAVTTVIDFDDSINANDHARGGKPLAALVSDGAGNLWGTTAAGGTSASGDGTVYKINASTDAITTVVDFDGSTSGTDNARGGGPAAPLVSDTAGNLWGTTGGGGEFAGGTVYKVNTSTGMITTMADIGRNVSGLNPEAAPVSEGAGNLWGTTTGGGANNDGTVYKVNASTGAISTVVNFDRSTDTTDNSRGYFPQAALVSDTAGNLWGTTGGGGASNAGTVFKIDPSTDTITTVADFDDSNDTTDNARGEGPGGALVSDTAGNLWGSTDSGGARDYGTLFKVSTSTGAITTVGDFDGSISSADNARGGNPNGGLVSDGTGNFWGTTSAGGSGFGGTVFKVNMSTGAISTLVDFEGMNSTPNNAAGAAPFAGLVSDGAGNFWGTTAVGGSAGYGTVYKISIATAAVTTLVNFDNSTTATDNSRNGKPTAALVSDGAGNLWGTTTSGQQTGAGTIFKVNIATGAITTLFDFTGDSGDVPGAGFGIPPGEAISGELVTTSSGIYGTTYSGGVTAGGQPGGGGEIFLISFNGPAPAIEDESAQVGIGGAAILTGSANPGGNDTSVYFEYGPTSSYGSQTPTKNIGSGTSPASVSNTITGLPLGTTYHFQMVATNAVRTTYGRDQALQVGPSYFGLKNAVVTASSITLGAAVDPNGTAGPASNPDNVLVFWQYGLAAGTYTAKTAAVDSGTGTAAIPVSLTFPRGALSNLYHYRLVVSSSVGNLFGPDQTFNAKPPSVVIYAPVDTLTGSTLSATVNPNMNDTQVTFQYGPDTTYGTSTSSQDIGGGSASVMVSATLSGLVPFTLYHYRVVTVNSLGTVYGPAQTFTTAALFGTTPVWAIGQAAPGISGATFSILGNPIINNYDHLAIQAKVAGVGFTAANNQGIWSESGTSGITLIARTGSAAPDYTGTATVGTFATLSDPVYSNNDDVAFLGTLVVGRTVPAAKKTGIWATTSGTIPGPLTLIARAGDLAPDASGSTSASSPTFASFSQFVLPDAGGIAMLARLSGAMEGIYQTGTDGVLREVVRTKESLMIGASSKTISALAIFNAPVGETGQTRHFNQSGTLTFVAKFTDKTSANYQSDIGATPISPIPQSVPGVAGATFSVLGNPAINDNDHTAFQAKVAGGGVTAANSSGIWAESGTSGLTLIARTGSSAPDYTGTATIGTFSKLSDPVYNNNDNLAFLGTLTVSHTVPAGKNVGIWATTTGTAQGPLTLIARVGDHAPDATGSASASSPTFLAFTQFVLPDQGGVLILSKLSGGTVGIFGVDTGGLLKQIIRTGQALTVNGAAKKISTLAIFGTPVASTGQSRHFNQAGDIAYLATFTDKSTAIIQSDFP
jgi:uncharacterized repeat protein (TIGR03803 family)